MTEGTTIMVERWLGPLQNPDSPEGRRARDELIAHSRRRMEMLCRKMYFRSLSDTPIDWEDVYQEGAVKLWKALEDAKPKTVREYFGLATKKIREVSLDMHRKYVRDLPPPEDDGASANPVSAAIWSEFHEQVTRLEPDLRETFELLWYHDLTQKEAAELLAIDESTVKRRWRRAREQLAQYVV